MCVSHAGLRTIALCRGERLEALVYTGVCGVCDPPRDHVHAAVSTLRRASVDVKMVTGDARSTALAIGTHRTSLSLSLPLSLSISLSISLSLCPTYTILGKVTALYLDDPILVPA